MFQPSVARPAVLAAVLTSFMPWAATAQDLPAAKITSAQGKTVRLTEADGTTRTGRLASLTTGGVVLQSQGQEVSVPLTRVRKVEKVAHGIQWGLLTGFAAGFIYGYGVAEEDLSGSSREVLWGVILGGMGAGAGAGVGALINRARRGGNVVYETGSGTKTFGVVPVLSPSGRIGLAVAASW